MVSKKHHYLPQFYLKQWANEKDQVWAYYPNREPFLCNVSNIGCENYLYSIERNDYLEQWLAQIDGDLSTVFDEVQDQKTIDESTILKLKAFLIVFMSRNPKSKNVREWIIDLDPRGIPKKNPFAQMLRFSTEAIASEIEPLNVQILQVPEEIDFSFVTSNQPFFIAGKLEQQSAEIPNNKGMVQRTSIHACWMPLTPKILVFYPSNEIKDQVILEDNLERLHKIDLELFSVATQYLISNSDSLFTDQPDLKELFNKTLENSN